MSRVPDRWHDPGVADSPDIPSVDRITGPSWEHALRLLESGDGFVNLRGLLLRIDPPTDRSGRRMHVQIPCAVHPSHVGRTQHLGLERAAQRDLEEARRRLAAACREDRRLADLVDGSGLVYELVHRQGSAALLVATAGRSGDLSWR